MQRNRQGVASQWELGYEAVWGYTPRLAEIAIILDLPYLAHWTVPSANKALTTTTIIESQCHTEECVHLSSY